MTLKTALSVWDTNCPLSELWGSGRSSKPAPPTPSLSIRQVLQLLQMHFTFRSISFDTLSAESGSEVAFCQLHTCQMPLIHWQGSQGHRKEEKKRCNDQLNQLSVKYYRNHTSSVRVSWKEICPFELRIQCQSIILSTLLWHVFTLKYTCWE
jgi:hypothetical protein